MIITCPECSARYKVKDGLVQEKGKKVKCKKCETVFVAYPGGRSVVKSTPKKTETPEVQAEPAPPAPVPEPEKPQQTIVSPATVRIDRSKLEGYMAGQEAASPQATTPQPRQSPATKPATEPTDGGATIQVDRSQIDAYIKQAQSQEVMPSEDATVHIDRAAIESAAQEARGPESPSFDEDDSATIQMEAGGPEPVAAGDTIKMEVDAAFSALNPKTAGSSDTIQMDVQPPGGGMDTIKMDTGAIMDMQPPQVQENDDIDFDTGETAAPEFGDNTDFDTGPSFEAPQQEASEPVFEAPAEADDGFEADIDFGDEAVGHEPDFPTDEELGINEAAAPDDDPFGKTDPFALGDEASPEPETAREPEVVKTYDARVDGKDYPNLSLETIGRWIHEDRLLESDQIDDGSGHYARADEYPEIATFFQEIDHAYGEEIVEQEAEKKGFFGKILSIFKK